MSTTQIARRENRGKVIARAFGSEPIALEVVGEVPGGVEVARPGTHSSTIGFPAGDVFVWNAAAYKRLRAAFERGENARLAKLWKSARPYGLVTK